MGENARDKAQWFPSALPLWELHSSGSCECLEPWLARQTNTKLGPQDTIRKFLKHIFLKCPCIGQSVLICMSYDQSQLGLFDSQPQIPWKQGSNEVRLERAIHRWKYSFKGHKIMSSHFQNRLDLRKIWASRILWQESQFWNSHLGVSRKSEI
jgi:hypothetical protein